MTLAAAVTAFRAALPGGDYQTAFGKLLAASKRASDGERDAAIVALLAPVDNIEVSGLMAVASGALVEDGGSPGVAIDAILDTLADGAAVIAAAGDALDRADLDAESTPPPTELARDERRWVAAFKNHVRGAMARLARDVDTRKRLRAHPRLPDALRTLAARTHSRHVYYLVEILDMLDDEPLVVIDIAHGNHVARYRAFGIRTNFHLMTILDLQDPLALARKRADFVQLRHGYHPFTALRPDGTTNPSDLLLGELRARDLPRFDGVRMVVRAPPVPARSFGVSLVAPIHEALREELRVERDYSRAEAAALIAAIIG